jgi:TolB-like protein/tRNA A-37 threonylcarbamoyl transferase component Bud32
VTDLDRLTTALADRYTIERELGAGGMATVYLAHDVKHDRKVALKMLRPDLAASLGADRFLREVRIAANLSHPHILPLYDSGEADGFLFYVMPYVEGESLREKLDREGELPIHEATRILKEIADALAYAHEHKVVHRDIKPDNVMLSGRHALVMDFGVAKAVSEATGRHQVTTAGVALGTPTYMAPEQAAADPHVDHRADIYALGVLGYELLAGRPPFMGNTPQQILSAQVTVAPDPLETYRSTVPQALSDMVMRCLEKKPADRWQTAEEMLEPFEALSTSSQGITPVETRPHQAVSASRGRGVQIAVAAAVILVAVAAVMWNRGSGGQSALASVGRWIAVLPFESARTDEESAFFTDGIHDDVLTQLGKIGSLRVIARSSVMEYRGTEKSLDIVGEELGVDALLLARVQRSGDQVRINVQLIDVATEEQLWGETYQRELTLDNRFAIQSEISAAVAEALEAALTPDDRARLAERPTDNAQAYALYQRAKDYYDDGYERENMATVGQLATQAVELDPRFSLALAFLSEVHSFTYWLAYDRTPERLALAKTLADSALILDPDLPEGHIALGHYHYWGFLDYGRALEEFAVAERVAPNNVNLLRGIGAVRRRQGRVEDALTYFRRAREADPRSPNTISEVAGTLSMLRRFDEAAAAFDSTIMLSPDTPYPRSMQAILRLACCADTVGAQRAIDGARGVGIPAEYLDGADGYVAWLKRNYAVMLTLNEGRPSPRDDQYMYIPTAFSQGMALRGLDDSTRATTAFQVAITELDSLITERPNDERLHSALGVTYAMLGTEDAALREARRGVELLPFEREAWRGGYRLADLATVFAQFGQADSAVHYLEFLLDHPGDVTVPLLRLDPVWDPIRDTPEFRRLVDE